jgi:hypothetical protein
MSSRRRPRFSNAFSDLGTTLTALCSISQKRRFAMHGGLVLAVLVCVPQLIPRGFVVRRMRRHSRCRAGVAGIGWRRQRLVTSLMASRHMMLSRIATRTYAEAMATIVSDESAPIPATRMSSILISHREGKRVDGCRTDRSLFPERQAGVAGTQICLMMYVRYEERLRIVLIHAWQTI